MREYKQLWFGVNQPILSEQREPASECTAGCKSAHDMDGRELSRGAGRSQLLQSVARHAVANPL